MTRKPSKFRVRVMLTVLCAERGITQKEIAERTGVRPATLSNLSQGKLGGIEFETMALICEALGCGPGDLFQLVPARDSSGQAEQLPAKASPKGGRDGAPKA